MPQRSRNIFNEQVVDRVELFPSQGCLTTRILGMTTALRSDNVAMEVVIDIISGSKEAFARSLANNSRCSFRLISRRNGETI